MVIHEEMNIRKKDKNPLKSASPLSELVE